MNDGDDAKIDPHDQKVHLSNMLSNLHNIDSQEVKDSQADDDTSDTASDSSDGTVHDDGDEGDGEGSDYGQHNDDRKDIRYNYCHYQEEEEDGQGEEESGNKKRKGGVSQGGLMDRMSQLHSDGDEKWIQALHAHA